MFVLVKETFKFINNIFLFLFLRTDNGNNIKHFHYTNAIIIFRKKERKEENI